MIIGAHLPIGRGLDRAAGIAEELQLDAVQLFTRSPRGGKARTWPDSEVEQFKGTVHRSSLDPVIIHVPYMVNLAADRPEIREYGVGVLIDDLHRAMRLGARFIVLHPGSHRSLTEKQGYEYLADGVRCALDQELPVRILLENMAGQGSELGHDIKALASFAVSIHPSLGICLDTCHAFAAGHNITDHSVVEDIFSHCQQLLGPDAIPVVHVNDSKHGLGSRRDRHANIGDGQISSAGFVPIIQRCRAQNIPLILETPVSDPLDYRCDVAALRQLN